MNRSIAVLLILGIVGAALIVTYYRGTQAPLAFSTVAAAVITFFYLMPRPNNTSGDASSGEGLLRRAIAGSIVVQYLVLVGLAAYLQVGAEKLPPITETLITNFTMIVGVVIAFYFGSSAYVQGQRQRGADLNRGDKLGKELDAQKIIQPDRAQAGDR